MTDQERDVIALNADAIDLMSNGLFQQSLPYLDKALRLVNSQLEEEDDDSCCCNPITSSPMTRILDDVDNMDDAEEDYLSDNIVIEMVSINTNKNDSDVDDDTNNDRTVPLTTATTMNWEHNTEFAIYDSACFIHGVADSSTNGIPPQFIKKTILALLYNVALATHLSTITSNSFAAAIDHQGLYKALQLYNHVLSVITNLNQQQVVVQNNNNSMNDDEDYSMLSLAVLNNMTSILFHLSHRQQAHTFLQMLSVRLALVSNQRHLFLDVYQYCKLNIAVRRSTTIMCAPMA